MFGPAGAMPEFEYLACGINWKKEVALDRILPRAFYSQLTIVLFFSFRHQIQLVCAGVDIIACPFNHYTAWI